MLGLRLAVNMSWFSNQWNRWNHGDHGGPGDVAWVEVQYGRQMYQVRLPQESPRILLGALRQEVGAVFGVPVDRVKLTFHGIVLKDDRISLLEYGLSNGSRIVLTVVEPQRAPAKKNNRQAPEVVAVPQPGEGTQGAPQWAPQGVPQGVPQAPQAPTQAQEPLQPQRNPEEEHLKAIRAVLWHCNQVIYPELLQFEKSIDALPNARPGEQTAEPKDVNMIPPARIPYAHRKLGEYLLRELFKLDDIPSDTDQVRTERKQTVRQIQNYMDRVDAGWSTASKSKGIVNDI
ncbi:hypothetical protein MVES1_002321 [Malassezia vespertilionis]|uniref:Uncharacterized protein n=1 Tax=Malassezia vespertilionis TaxID=2020962 RepID=A0A2N1JBD9_9BASI|nr:uncharacterized protein MVES1_002321 [Malassezia vespertilionis]PKI83871.1 hypothetical protein MVES_002187 [Malassezia vespertilionis]WFD06966.1 hypothetical protein MVES1_002321 [Malassezia vespertilionis]